MFSLFKKKKNEPKVPEWANFLTSSEYEKFLESIEKYFKNKGIAYELSDGVIHVKNDDFGFNQLGLSNVAQLCKLEGIAKCENVVKEHFDGMVQAHQFDIEFKKIIDDFEKVKDYIGVRLYNDGYLEQVNNDITITKNVAPGIHEMLIFDMPHAVTSIQPDQVVKWGKTSQELFTIGENNIREKYSFNISQEQFGDFKIRFVQADHFFVPNILLEMDQYPGLVGSQGSLVGVPHRHAAIIYPIENLEVVNVINQLIPTIKGMYAEGPGSLSAKLYWLKKDGTIIELPSEISEKKLKFIPPEEFVNMLNTLEKKD